MKPILTPTAVEVLRCVHETMESGIIPSLTGKTERSNAATIQHMLRFVENRMEQEGQTLFDEIARLRAFLPTTFAWLEAQAKGAALVPAIKATVETRRPAEVYPTLTMVSDDVAALRQHVCDLLELLHAAPEGDAEARRLHAEVRAYIVWQLEQEGSIVEPTFVGNGPRR